MTLKKITATVTQVKAMKSLEPLVDPSVDGIEIFSKSEYNLIGIPVEITYDDTKTGTAIVKLLSGGRDVVDYNLTTVPDDEQPDYIETQESLAKEIIKNAMAHVQDNTNTGYIAALIQETKNLKINTKTDDEIDAIAATGFEKLADYFNEMLLRVTLIRQYLMVLDLDFLHDDNIHTAAALSNEDLYKEINSHRIQV